MFILISLQVFSDDMGTAEKWQKGHTGLACCPLQHMLIPQTGSSLRVWLETKSMQRLVGDLSMTWQRVHLFHMALVLKFKPYIGCQMCYTVVGLTTAAGTLGSYQPLNWAQATWVCSLRCMQLTTAERNY